MKRLPKNRVPASISFPIDLLQEVDELAYSMGLSRTDFVLMAVKEKMQKLQEDKK